MFSFAWPIALAVVSNIFYHICAKSAPEGMDPFASLTITYAVAAAVSAILFFNVSRGNLLHEWRMINWASVVLGVVIVGLEVGFIYAYRAGWQVSTASIVMSAFLAIALLFVGWLLYREQLSWNKVLGVVICLIGLWFINK